MTLKERVVTLSRGSRKLAAVVLLINTGSLVTLALLGDHVSGLSPVLLSGVAGLEVGCIIGIALGYLAGREPEEEATG